MEKEKFNEYIMALKEKGVDAPCPRCGHKSFDIVGESIVSIQEEANVIRVGGPSVPVVLAVCTKCGYLTMHAQGPLGMMRGGQNG